MSALVRMTGCDSCLVGAKAYGSWRITAGEGDLSSFCTIPIGSFIRTNDGGREIWLGKWICGFLVRVAEAALVKTQNVSVFSSTVEVAFLFADRNTSAGRML